MMPWINSPQSLSFLLEVIQWFIFLTSNKKNNMSVHVFFFFLSLLGVIKYWHVDVFFVENLHTYNFNDLYISLIYIFIICLWFHCFFFLSFLHLFYVFILFFYHKIKVYQVVNKIFFPSNIQLLILIY